MASSASRLRRSKEGKVLEEEKIRKTNNIIKIINFTHKVTPPILSTRSHEKNYYFKMLKVLRIDEAVLPGTPGAEYWCAAGSFSSPPATS